jgi:hypothetical protein
VDTGSIFWDVTPYYRASQSRRECCYLSQFFLGTLQNVTLVYEQFKLLLNVNADALKGNVILK